MDKKELVFKEQSQRDILNEFIENINNENLYKAIMCYNRLNSISPECYLYLAGFYAKLGDMTKEVNALLKALTFKDYNKYNVRSLLYRINLFFYVYNGFDVFDFYKSLVIPRFPGDEELKFIENPFYKKDESKKLKLVKTTSREFYEEATKLLSENKNKEAFEILDKIKEGNPEFNKAQFIKYMIKASTEESATPNSALGELTISAKNDIENDEVDPENFDAIMLQSLIFIDKKDYEKALKVLKKLNTIDVYNAKYLKRLILVYCKLGNTKKVIETLKEYVALYPKDAFLRMILTKLVAGKDVDVESFLNGAITKNNIEEMQEFVVGCLVSEKKMNSLSKEEANYVFYLALELNDHDLINSAALTFLNTNYKEVVEDSLMCVDTDHVARQLIFQAFIENGYTNPLFVLINGRLEEIILEYPKVFSEKIGNEDEAKMHFLKVIYSQVLSLLYFSGIGKEKFLEKKDKIFNYLYKTRIEENPLMLNANNIVYALATIFTDNDKDVQTSFSYVKDANKKEMLKIFNDIMLKI